MVDIFEEVISNWLFSKGYFVINNLKVGANEIDLLAVKVAKGIITQKIHIEVHCATDPIGYIGGSRSSKKRSEKEIEKGVVEYINKKFLLEKTKGRVELFFGKDYDKWFICGRLKDEFTVEAFEKHKIEVKRIWDILEEYRDMFKNKKSYLGTAQGNRYNQLLLLSQRDRT